MFPSPRSRSNPLTFVIGTGLPADAALASARERVRSFDRQLVLTDPGTLDGVLRQTVGDQRFRTWLLSGFAAIAILLAALGIYGVLAYFVAERTREIGVRLALGAAPANVWTMVVAQGMRPVAWGLAAGLAAATAAARLIASLLFGIVPLDPGQMLPRWRDSGSSGSPRARFRPFAPFMSIPSSRRGTISARISGIRRPIPCYRRCDHERPRSVAEDVRR